jgi:hypothetical protein
MPQPDDQKIQGSQPKEDHPAIVNEVDDAAQGVGKPATEPVERTAELLSAEHEVSKAGIETPRDDDQPVPR